MGGCVCQVSWSELGNEFSGCLMTEQLDFDSKAPCTSMEPKMHWSHWEKKGWTKSEKKMSESHSERVG